MTKTNSPRHGQPFRGGWTEQDERVFRKYFDACETALKSNLFNSPCGDALVATGPTGASSHTGFGNQETGYPCGAVRQGRGLDVQRLGWCLFVDKNRDHPPHSMYSKSDCPGRPITLPIARAAVRSVVGGPVLDRYLAEVWAYRQRVLPHETPSVKFVKIAEDAEKRRIGFIPVAVLSGRPRHTPKTPGIEREIPGEVVWLSAETAVKQVIHHDDLTASDYRQLPEVIEHGEAFNLEDQRRLVVFHELASEKLYRAVIKTTRDGERFLTTFHRANQRDREAIRRRLLNGDG